MAALPGLSQRANNSKMDLTVKTGSGAIAETS